jgi:hypothetical protein
VLVIVMVVGIVFPLVGLSLIAALAWEVMLVAGRRASGHFVR